MNRVAKWAGKLFLFVSRAVPRRVAAHCLHLLRQSPALTDRWGYSIRPIHYYEPVPDFRSLSPRQLTKKRIPVGVEFDIEGQARRVEDLGRRFRDEIRALDRPGPEGFPFRNDYFAGMDAALYYALIRDLKPARVLEIGAGYSTQIAAKAIAANAHEGRVAALSVIEPYPQPRLTAGAIKMQLIVKPVEEVELSTFSELQANDILFIDSSHALRCGGDVFFEILEILPRVNPGVWIHVHDIFFPLDYPPEWVLEQRLSFNEQYFLEAFLMFNERFVPRVANHWLALEMPASAAALWHGDLTPRPTSFWFSREQEEQD